MEKSKLPVFYLNIDENIIDSGVSAISFVDTPATTEEWYKFNKLNDHNRLLFVTTEEKRIITGPVMLAETEILRFSDIIGYYKVKFSESTILKMVIKYFKENKIHNVNEDHNSDKQVNGVYMVESYIVGDNVKSMLYKDVKKGSWIASFYISDEEYWEELKSKDFTGFSLEGKFIEQYEKDLVEQMYNGVVDILSSDISDDEKEIKIKSILNV